MRLAALLSFACGFASLSLEILWVRLYGFANSSTPKAFGLVLCVYLLGIAVGASVGARACRNRSDLHLWRSSIVALLLSALLSPLLPALFAAAAAAGLRNPLMDVAMIGTAAAVLSFVFPIAHHLGTREVSSRRGRHFARVYTANVMGAALGPLITGYLLLDTVSLQSSFLIVGALQAAVALLLARAIPGSAPSPGLLAASLLGGGCFAVAAATLEPHSLVRQFTQQGVAAATVLENRHGIITIFAGPGGDDIVYGGNVYDGRTNLDPVRNTNGLDRPLLMSTLHSQPRRVLMAGLSIGTWLALIREFPGVETIDVIEINPGYIEAAAAYPRHAAALRDPRVHLVIDDARRWLRHRPERQYDMVIMNTTLHWRAHASLLLSQQLLEQMRAHMAPGAVLAFNATGSPDAFHTASRVFAHAYRYQNFVYGSDVDFRPRKDSAAALATLAGLRLGGEPMFAAGSSAARALLDRPFVSLAADAKAAGRPLEAVTDDNMITEFKYGRPLYFWSDLFVFDALQ